ncbi:hypothetical protein P691DRAFT_809359 [Macrolepiota fuliginosa MF-IS2]|uniref:Uncharacterized protein n=1 Tax=Macrolepiota fuliginosa MF-IS2 TaxID=1400762 RepID=A0A9P5XH42_9AGAR|nr:hypothetical protein P691DRAFT_809359 [Macrolepiota fuliginosa MF-IS2]
MYYIHPYFLSSLFRLGCRPRDDRAHLCSLLNLGSKAEGSKSSEAFSAIQYLDSTLFSLR